MLELVARRLGADLCARFAFVGGAVAGLLITDPANLPIRPTEDVDIVAEVLALSGYHRIEKALRERGFSQDMSADAPICRWKVEGVAVDVMPTMETILGFANRWHLFRNAMSCFPKTDIHRKPDQTLASPKLTT